ncbi:EPIDERMAL PATTERNING FACTOR-like protein 1 isoform X2 [Selaginella moellendorffii]|uniref:EPIDERMAL PATTERNING FACTOR-like protein 1 isoform X2 n=1 Tax=Selaginella moellendorffii TaxID=88036 RepID=UPI000D1C366B|nr:EPIDERMAL PATTERNING FACTOR-like protein 1 isoform X2 [Selaginella moellendorffii]|eukprot:XP_024533725.1 EPIDERMAL PATTERNING FACTOR-like protein 1 isoform X2 [Selaginella moellendorffii]
MLVKLSTILFIFLVSCCETTGRPAWENGFVGPHDTSSLQVRNQQAAARRTAASRIGSRPPSCINKCDSCTPCQAVQASQQSLAEMSSNIGSRPPSCQNKCNRCIPCQAVQVPTPIERKSPVVPRKREHRREHRQEHEHQQEEHQEHHQHHQQVSVEYSNYKPEGWRCKCGNKLFNP